MHLLRVGATGLVACALLGCQTPGGPGTGSGANYTPIIDTKGIDQETYSRDLAECRAYASSIDAGGQICKTDPPD